MRMAHTPSLIEQFPPPSNQHGAGHWPVVRVLVAHDLRTGLAMRPEWGPMSGPNAVSEQQLLEWANVSDYMRIPGMGRAKVGLVRAAGVTTVRELALRNPSRLAESMKEVNTRRKLVRILPSEKSVEQLIAQARKLQPKITY